MNKQLKFVEAMGQWIGSGFCRDLVLMILSNVCSCAY